MIYINTSNIPKFNKEIYLNIKEVLPYRYISTISFPQKRGYINLVSKGKKRTKLLLEDLIRNTISLPSLNSIDMTKDSYINLIYKDFLDKNDFYMYELKSSFLSTDKKCFSSKLFSNGSINVPLYSGNHTIVFSADHNYYFRIFGSKKVFNFKLIKYSSDRKNVYYESLNSKYFIYTLTLSCITTYTFSKEVMEKFTSIFNSIYKLDKEIQK
ncbi:MAG: hypothetical protein QW350_04040 [Candidatus Aenigmatarchaeota archaeon]